MAGNRNDRFLFPTHRVLSITDDLTESFKKVEKIITAEKQLACFQ